MYKICLLIITSTIIFSCSKSDNPTPPPTSTKGLIPLAVGNSWMYKKSNFDSNGNLVSTTGDTIQILSQVYVNGVAYYQQYQTSVTNIKGGSFFVNVDSNTVDKIDSATRYTFFKEVSTDNVLVDTWTDTVQTHCEGHNDLYGYTGTTNINSHDCLKNVVLVTDCTGLTFEKWIYYLQPSLGLVRIEHYVLDNKGAFYLQFSDDLEKYSISN